MLEIDFPSPNALTNEVVVHFDMFSSGVEHGVLSEVDGAHIVVDDANRIHKTPRSFRMRLSHTASHAATVVPLYSASMLDTANVGCFLMLQEIAPLPREKTNPDVDRRSAL